jgi:hypothetical protein
MSADLAGNLYFVQTPATNSRTGLRIRRIDTAGIVNTIAGGPAFSASPDGPPLQTAILPGTIAADNHGNVAFTESLPYNSAGTDAVREVTAQATLITLAGAAPKPAPDGTPARDAWLINPTSIAFNRAGDLFIAEAGVCLIRKIGANGVLSTASGTGKCGNAHTLEPSATQDLAPPTAIVADNQGRLYLVDTFGNSYVIAPDGIVSPASLPPTLVSGKLAFDAKGRLYLMSMFNLIRISPDGKQETIVALPTQAGVPP